MGAKFTIESVCQCRLFTKGVMIMVRQLGYGFRGVRLVGALVGVTVLLSGWLSGPALAASAKEIDTGADEAIVMFEKEVKDGKSFLQSSKGVLVFPTVIKGGAGFGGEYGEGALRIGGQDGGLLQYCCRVHLDCNSEGRSKPSSWCFWRGRPETVPGKRRLEGGGGRLRLPGHLGSRGCHRYAESERPDRRIRLGAERVDVQPVVRRNEIHEAEEELSFSLRLTALRTWCRGLNPLYY